MKHCLLSLLFILFISAINAQARLGASFTEIKTEFSDSKFSLENGFDKEGDLYISIETLSSKVIYYFNESKICELTIIIPNNQGALNYYVENYNKQYVIINSTEWKMYSAEGIASIQLIYPDSGGYLFIWSSNE
jgi:hypothetical protein